MKLLLVLKGGFDMSYHRISAPSQRQPTIPERKKDAFEGEMKILS